MIAQMIKQKMKTISILCFLTLLPTGMSLAATETETNTVNVLIQPSKTVQVPASTASLVFPDDFLPSGSRPQLWLTPTVKSRLKAAKAANTPEWQRFYTDAREMFEGTFWTSEHTWGPSLGLMYQLTDNDEWAEKGVAAMEALIPSDPNTPCSSPGGDPDIDGTFEYLALGYDWLHDSTPMTEPRRTALAECMVELADSIWANSSQQGPGIDISEASNTDYVTMTGAMYLMFGASLYGDDPVNGLKLLNRGWWNWNRGLGSLDPSHECWAYGKSVREWVRRSIGGIFPTG